MAREKKPRLKQVNALLLEEDVEAIKAMARAELSQEWHPKLRQVVHLGVQAAKKRRIIK